MKVYVINLDRHPERLEHMREQLSGVPFERIPAVDGAAAAPTTRGLSRFELACLTSHRMAWRQFLNTPHTHACFLEDDVHVRPDFAAFVQSEAWIPLDAHSVKLDTYLQSVKLGRRRTTIAGREIARLYSRHESAAAYLLTRTGAMRYLEMSASAKTPADYCVFPRNPRRLGLRIYQLTPAVAIQDHLIDAAAGGNSFATAMAGSGSKRSVVEKLQREVIRLATRSGGLVETLYVRATVNPESTTVGLR
jgi:GR25 family glycosyltransferase involved in LPS biosynthesis